MNSEGKKLIILGLISIAICSLTLFSLKDVKFKNTKKIVNDNNVIVENQIDITELDNNDVNNIGQDNNITTGDLSILIPSFFENNGFDQLKSELNLKDINVVYYYVDSYDDLKSILKNNISDYDIILMPSDWLGGLDLESIYLGENIKPYFTNSFQNILSEDGNKFIPYSIDPFITIKKDGIQDINSWSKIISYMMFWEQEKVYSYPILWGIGEKDINLLIQGSASFENYFEILYQQINLIKQNHNSNELNNMLDIEGIELPFKYNYDDFYNIYTRLAKSNSYCTKFPRICMMSYNFTDSKFGLISDFDIFDKYFEGKGNKYIISEFTNSNINYPIRGRGFVIPKGNDKIKLSTTYFQQYIQDSIDGNLNIWNNTLPAITNMYDEKKSLNLYKNIIHYENNFSLFIGDINLQDQFVSEKKNIDLLKGGYNTEIYISQ